MPIAENFFSEMRSACCIEAIGAAGGFAAHVAPRPRRRMETP